MMNADMTFLFAPFSAGHPSFSDFEQTTFRQEFNSVTWALEKKGEKRLNALLANESRLQGLCWKRLKKLNNPVASLSVEPEIWLDHFESIYFNKNEPLFFLGRVFLLRWSS